VALLRQRQHSAVVPAGGTLVLTVRRHVRAFALCAAIATVACSAPAPDATPTGPSGEADIARARALTAEPEKLAPAARLPERADALALAESIEGRAVHEGAGTRAAELHLLAARLVERVWRVEGRTQDADEALDLYRAAAHDPAAGGACEGALAAARLAGDVAHDATTTYAELYRAQRRFASSLDSSVERDAGPAPSEPGHPGPPTESALSACRHELEDGLALLVAFRPPQRVLEAIDEGLAGEGAIAPVLGSALDAGAAAAPVKAPQIVRIESWPGRDAARVVVVLDRPAAYRVGDELLAGSNSPRTFVDLDGVDVGSAPREADAGAAGTSVVTRIRAEATSTGSRVSLDLDGHAWRRVFYMHEPYRIVVDVARHPPGVKGGSSRTVTRVVVDPGHGGRDTGAIGPAGVKEKDVTLDVAHRVAPVLAAQGIQVVLTRDDDRFVSLEERTARANAFGADLFVSIHCNASESRGRRGIETYVLDTTRDEIASRVAARENATTQAASAELASILGGMRMADEAQRSTRFAQLLERAAVTAAQTSAQTRMGDVVDGGVHTAGFYVLVGARMPSVLLESGYISNPTEEQRLGAPDYRQLLADAIANAVQAYREGR
jgi:N-acetylmuramoyl-L-alanine amidase